MPNQMRRARAGIKASEILLRQSRNQGYAQTNDIIDAVYGNLMSTQRGTAKKLGAEQGRILGSLSKLQHATNQKNARLASGAERKVTNMYGSVITGATDFSANKAQSKAGRVALGGANKAAETIAAGNTSAERIAKAGVQQAWAGAAYGASQALAYRAKNDATLIAQQRFELQKMQLQNQLDLENYRKKLALDEQADPTQQGASTLTQTAVNMSTWMRQYLGGHPGASAMEAYNQYIQAFPLAAGSAEDTLAQRLATTEYQLVTGGETNQGEEVSQVTSALQGLYPHFRKNEDTITGYIRHGIHQYWLGVAATPPADEGSAPAEPGSQPGYTPSTNKEAATAANGGQPVQPVSNPLGLGGGTDQTHYIDPSTGYVVEQPQQVTKGQAATPTSIGTTKSGRQYRIVGGNPYYIDTGYVVPAVDLP